MKRKAISMLLILCICSIIPVNILHNDTTHNEQNGVSYYSDDWQYDVAEK